jgi:DNA-binding response OmpR family regulator
MRMSGSEPKSQEPSARMVLWIEDDPVFLHELFRVWRPDFEVKTATSSAEALSILVNCVPDLICLDLSLPHHLATVNDEEGFALLTAIRKHRRLDAPIAVVTRHTDPAVRDRALELGADAVVTKPVKIEHLEGVLTSLLANRH